jgi:hypothetical protein
MISARLIAFFVVCFAFALVLSTPTPNDVSLYKRSDSDAVLAILVTVKNDIAKTIPKIGRLHFASVVKTGLTRHYV